MSARRTAPRIDDAYTYHGIDAVLLENSQLRILVVPGKGGDILEFRDKQTDVDVLWHADHEWTPPDAGTIPEPESASWLDHYPVAGNSIFQSLAPSRMTTFPTDFTAKAR